MQIRRTLLVVIAVLGVLLSGSKPIYAQGQDTRYFPETGHWVSGDFLHYYESARDPLLNFGYPITEAIQDSLSRRTVQYFQRARFELHIEEPQEKRVELSPLGEWLIQPGEPVKIPYDPAACQYFSQTDHNVCYAFLDFYNANGGQSQFGAPLSEIEILDGVYVQYFELARFEWHPELPSGKRVTLGDLGKLYFDQRGLDPSLLTPPGDSAPQSLVQVQARAFVAQPVTWSGSHQTLYVIVQDSSLHPVSQATVAAKVVYPSGREDSFSLPLTDDNGISQITFPVGKESFNTVAQIKVEVSYAGSDPIDTETWFRIWW